uniref:C2H2-type domain-containing protein n=1 Tax=Kalanchoe fedtschenkoi TaxID=63787 RepID=A0A7N0RBJ8_KALFE
MATVWLSLKNSMHCKSGPTDVHDPKSRTHLSTILTKKIGRSGCSRSIANLKDAIHGSKRHLDRPPSCSPRSIGSSDFLNPITHEVILSNSRCELKITSFAGFQDGTNYGGRWCTSGVGGSTFVGTLRPGTPGPGGKTAISPFYKNSSWATPLGNLLFCHKQGSGLGGAQLSQHWCSFGADSNSASSSVACHKCGEQFSEWEAVEAHHLSMHAGDYPYWSIFFSSNLFSSVCLGLYKIVQINVRLDLDLHKIKRFLSLTVTELVEGDSSRKVAEIICRTSCLKAENPCGRIEKVLKVHNMQKTLARFEEYREAIKIKANKLPTKHPRCLADGNELLRFYGTTVSCSLGLYGRSSLCIVDKCCVCRILRNGFSAKKELKCGIGVFTISTSGRAFEIIETLEDNGPSIRKANIQDIAGQSGFDSLAGKVGLYSNIEELYLLNPKALLPCFVVICKS